MRECAHPFVSTFGSGNTAMGSKINSSQTILPIQAFRTPVVKRTVIVFIAAIQLACRLEYNRRVHECNRVQGWS